MPPKKSKNTKQSATTGASPAATKPLPAKEEDKSKQKPTEPQQNVGDDDAAQNDSKAEGSTVENNTLEEGGEEMEVSDAENLKFELKTESKTDTRAESPLIIHPDDNIDAADESENNVSENNAGNNSVAETEEANKEQQPAGEESATKSETEVKPKKKCNYIWVSNIDRTIKANDLKKLFSQIGKVTTAKILSNGKNFFGYVSMENSDLAEECIAQLNETLLNDNKLSLSQDRPDLTQQKDSAKSEGKKETDKQHSEAPTDTSSVTKDSKSSDEIRNKNLINQLKRKLDIAQSDSIRFKRKIDDYERRHEGMRSKCADLELQLKKIKFENRSDRRRLDHERDEFEKSKKLDQVRMDADKAILAKELDEVRQLREQLKMKIDELKSATKKVSYRSRSPDMRDVHRPTGLGNPNRFRSDERPEKRPKREEFQRGRTPPPPPKLSDQGRKRMSDNQPIRSYYSEGDNKKPSPGNQFDYRQKSSFGQPPDFLMPYPKDQRRTNPPASGSGSGSNYRMDSGRYGNGYQQQPQSFLGGPPRGAHNTNFLSNYGSHY